MAAGLDLLTEARAEGLVQDVIMLTAARDAASVQTALQHGASDFLVKPFTRERLYAALDALEQRHQAMQSGEREFTQQALDRLLGYQGAAAPPKWVDAHTLERVLSSLREAGAPLSAEEVGAAVGIHRATAWPYLEQLTESEQAEVVEYGSVGRPTKRYQLRLSPAAEQTKEAERGVKFVYRQRLSVLLSVLVFVI